MGLLLISVTLYTVGIILTVKMYDELWEMMGGFFIAVFGIITPILLIVWGFAYMNNSDSVYKYMQDKAYIESLSGNKQLTDEERRKAIDIVLSTNNDILQTRRWNGNFMIGIYYSHAVGDLELLDINKIPKATKSYNVEVKQ